MNRYALTLSTCFFAGVFACAPEQMKIEADTVLVQVGELGITVAALEKFVAALPEHLRSDGEAQVVQREYLRNLVERQLMIQEAEKRGLGDLPELEWTLDDLVNKRLAKEIVVELVDVGLQIDDEELRQAYEEYGLGWEVWPAHILSADEDDARAVIRALRAGRSFSKVANEHSLADDAAKGGNLDGFFGPGDVVPNLRDATFHLEEGQFSEPIKTKDGYEIVKVLKKRRNSFENMRDGIVKQMAQRKWVQRRDGVVDSLGTARGIRYERSRVHAVLKGLFDKGLTPKEAAEALIVYDGGQILVGDAVRGLRSIKKGALPPDSARVFLDIERWILPDSLMALLAREQGRHQRADVLELRLQRRRALLVGQLRSDAVAGVKVGEGEVRSYYEKYLDTYKKLPGPIRMTEVLVKTRAEAEDLLARARNGERLEVLAAKNSLRLGLDPVGGHVLSDSGRIEIESLYQSPYRTFFGDSNDKDVGVLQGPLEVQDRYSIFRLDAPFEKMAISFTQLKRPIRVKIREGKEGEIFSVFLDSLRASYADQIIWHEDVLKSYVATR